LQHNRHGNDSFPALITAQSLLLLLVAVMLSRTFCLGQRPNTYNNKKQGDKQGLETKAKAKGKDTVLEELCERGQVVEDTSLICCEFVELCETCTACCV